MEIWLLILVAVLAGGAGSSLTLLYFKLRSRRRIHALALSLKKQALSETIHPVDNTEVQTTPEMVDLALAVNQLAYEVRSSFGKLSAERNTMATLLSNLTDGIISTDGEGKVTLINESARRLLSISPNLEVNGRTFMQVVRDHDLNVLFRQTLEDGKERREILEVGPRRPQLQVKTTLIDTGLDENDEGEEGSKKAGLIVLQDLTEVSRLERIRRDFVANISHELRTPLASVKLMVETLHSAIEDDPQAARDFLRRIDTELDGLTQLVRELLELSRIESGQVKFNLRSVDLRDLLQHAAERLRPQAERRGLTLDVAPRGSDESFPLAQADPDRLVQVLINLIHNAIKFTPVGGKITLSVSRYNDDKLVVKVADTGVGIPPDDVKRIFERFYKVDKARAGGEPGTGLGLAIAKHIVQGHSGEIWAESEFGSGSTFYFTVPIFVIY